MNRIFRMALALACAVFALACCRDKEPKDNFDRKQMLREIGESIIKPAFNNSKTQVDALVTTATAFADAPSTTKLTQLQTAWRTAYLAYQSATVFNFGEAGEAGAFKGLAEEVATFPASKTKIEANITANNTNFANFDRDSRGFLATEYLIFDAQSTPEQIVAKFDANRKAYLKAVANHLKSNIDRVANSWNGAYLQAFIDNDGTAVGSSVSTLYNEFLKSYENLKNYKIATPLGKKVGVPVSPHLVEAYYSGYSIVMLKEHFKTIEATWRKFIPYLQSVEGGAELVTTTENQITACKTVLNAIAETPAFATQIQNAPASFDNLYIEFQKLVRYFKSDMSSRLGIAITYSSGDGD